MKEFTVKIPDNQLDFFVELMKKLKISFAPVNEDFIVPEAHKQLIRGRISKLKKEELINWDDLQKQLDKENDI